MTNDCELLPTLSSVGIGAQSGAIGVMPHANVR